jgi:protein-disulfide isomerase
MPDDKPRSTAERAAAALRAQRAAERRRQFAIVGSVLAVLLIIGGVTWFAISRGDTTGAQVSSSGTPANTDGYAVVVGDAAAPTTLTVYEDPQCPVCAAFEQSVGDQVSQGIADGKVKVEYRIISFLDLASKNEYSSRAANALYAVADTSGPDVFKKFHDLLYANQPEEGTAGPTDDQLVQYAVQAGADEAAVKPKIEDGAYAQFVVNATDQSSQDGVNGTPSVAIDGTLVSGTPQDAIDAVLNALK